MARRLTLLFAICLTALGPASLRAGEGFFDSAGVKIHYLTAGEGPPVVLIHGFAVNPELQWMFPGIMGALAKDYRVIAMDCRGHGRSDKPRAVKDYGPAMAEDVVRLLDHLRIKKAHVVGYSMGGFIALRLAVSHPERLLSVTTGGAGWAPEVDEELNELIDRIASSLEEGKGITPLIDYLTPSNRLPPTADQLRTVNAIMLSLNDAKALAAAMRGLKDLWIPEDQLRANKVPTLAIVGSEDPLKKGVDQLKGRLENYQCVVIPGADHMNAFAKPQFLQATRHFLAAHTLVGEHEAAIPAAAGHH